MRMGRKYIDTRKQVYPLSIGCEHCDGEKSPLVRNDTDEGRGHICPWCDDDAYNDDAIRTRT
jgi:hypothetical protein